MVKIKGGIMRDPKRINQAMYYLNKIWMNQPDTRFNQLIYNLQHEFNKVHQDKYTKKLYHKESSQLHFMFVQTNVVELFDVEDDQFIEFLKTKVEQLKPEEEL
jgi:hypothetical protein